MSDLQDLQDLQGRHGRSDPDGEAEERTRRSRAGDWWADPVRTAVAWRLLHEYEHGALDEQEWLSEWAELDHL